MNIIEIIQKRKKMGLLSTFFTFLSDGQKELIDIAGYRIVQTDQGFYVFV